MPAVFAAAGNRSLVADSHPSSSPAPAIVLFGSPGSGKGTQAKLLKSCLQAPHISTGDMLRSHIEAGDDIGRRSQALIRAGKLVPDELVNDLVEARLANPDTHAGTILDGYPRTLQQADVLLGFTNNFGFRPAVVHLVVDCDKIVARLSGRRQCPVCGTLYSSKTNPPKVTGICDLDGAPLVTREDDRESVIRERLREYDEQTRPILNRFRERGVPLFEIDGDDSAPEAIARQICDVLAAAGLVKRVAGNKAVSTLVPSNVVQ